MRYVAVVLLTCCLSAVAYFAAGIGMAPAPIAAEYWVRQMIVVKRSIARQQSGRPKVIVASGSSSLFGVDAAQLGRELGVPVVNFGLHAALPLEKILEEAASAAQAGDAIVLALEPVYYCSGGITEWQARNTIAWDPERWAFWSTLERVRAIAAMSPTALAEIAAARFGNPSSRSLARRVNAFDDEKILAEFEKAPPPERFGYSAYHLDKLGNMLRIDGAEFRDRARPADAETRVCQDSLDALSEFVRRMKAKGVVVRFANSPFVADGDLSPERIADASRRFSGAIGGIAPVLDARKDVLFTREYFFNTDSHLNARGRELRTTNLAKAIAKDEAMLSHLGLRIGHGAMR